MNWFDCSGDKTRITRLFSRCLRAHAVCLVAALLFSLPGCSTQESENTHSGGKSDSNSSTAQTPTRKFSFSYSFSLQDVPKSAKVQIWIPEAVSNDQQEIVESSMEVKGALGNEEKQDQLGNTFRYIEGQQGDSPIRFSANYLVERKEAGPYKAELGNTKEAFLKANSKVPIDGKPLELLQDVTLADNPVEAARQLYDIVEQHMAYDKSKPGYGFGDSVWACDSKTGNCTDFHSLFISLARSQSIPARFEIGFPLPADKSEGKVGGYHCWAWFYDTQQKVWTPVDISEADKHPEMKEYYFGKLTQDRISFTTGRDIELDPLPAAGKLNYFVYPHVEVNGEVWPKEKIQLEFRFQDEKSKEAKK